MQRSNDAVAKDAQIEPSEEECVKGMERRSNYVAMRAAQIKPCMEECA